MTKIALATAILSVPLLQDAATAGAGSASPRLAQASAGRPGPAQSATPEETKRAESALGNVANQEQFAKALLNGDVKTMTALYNRAGGTGTVRVPQGIGKWPNIKIHICWKRTRPDGTVTEICLGAEASMLVRTGPLRAVTG